MRNTIADKMKLITDSRVEVIDDEYFLVQNSQNLKSYYLYQGKNKQTGFYYWCTRYKDVVVLQRTAIEQMGNKYAVIIDNKLKVGLDEIDVVKILIDNIDFTELIKEELRDTNDFYTIDDSIIDVYGKNPLISVIVQGEFIRVILSLEHFGDYYLITNKAGERIADFLSGVGYCNIIGDKMLLGFMKNKDIAYIKEKGCLDDTILNKLQASDKIIVMNKSGEIIKRFSTKHIKILQDVLIIQGRTVVDINSMQELYKDIIDREFKKNKENISIKALGNIIGVICGKCKIGQKEMGKCSIINFKTKKVYEDVVAYNFNVDYNAVIIDTGDSVDVINSVLGKSVNISGKLDKIYTVNDIDKSKLVIIRMKDGTRYKIGIGCNIKLWDNKIK